MTTSDDTRTAREMKVTAVRLSEDLWGLLDAEATRVGISVSQYMREAALARAAFAVAARAGTADELLAAWAQALFSGEGGSVEQAASTQKLVAALVRSDSRDRREEAAALRAESRQARRQAGAVRKEGHGRPREG